MHRKKRENSSKPLSTSKNQTTAGVSFKMANTSKHLVSTENTNPDTSKTESTRLQVHEHSLLCIVQESYTLTYRFAL